jgi:hypothetical protein
MISPRPALLSSVPRGAIVFGPALAVGALTAVASAAGWPFPQILVHWGAAAGAPIDALTRPVFFSAAWPVIALVGAAALCMRRSPSAGSPDDLEWDVVAAITLAVCAVPFFTGIERDVGSNFISHWQCWDCPRELHHLREGLAIGPGTARCSMDGLPYRLLARLAWTPAGAGWTALRLLSATAILGATAWTYLLLSRHLSRLAALAGMVLFATSPLVIDLAHVPSFLGPSVLLAIAILDGYLRWIDSEGERGGVLLGLLLFIGLYGYSPLRFLHALLPLAALIVVVQRRGDLRARLAPLLPVGLSLLVPVIVVMGLSRSDPVDLFYADGEFLPTQTFADENRFRVITHTHGAGSIGRSAAALRESCLAGVVTDNHDDGRVGPFTALHVTWILLGLVGAAAGRSWRRPVGAFLAIAAVGQIVTLMLMYPPAMRRMVAFAPLLLLIGAGGFDLLVPRSLRETSSRRAAAAVAAIALALFLPVALATMPDLRRPSESDVLASPCEHGRQLTTEAVEAGRVVLLWPDGGENDGVAAGDTCDFAAGIWEFHCAVDGRRRPLRLGEVSGAPFSLSREQRIGAGAVDAPVAWMGRESKLVFVVPGTEEGDAVLNALAEDAHIRWCD